MKNIDINNPTTKREQKKQGFFEIRKLKLIKLNATEIIGADIRTSEGDDRIELSRKNQLGFPEEGLYLYSNGNIATSFSQNTINFYDNDGNLKGIIQMPTAGVLSIGAGSYTLTVSESGIRMSGLPTSNPGGTGYLWNDSGTIKIT